MKVGILGAGAIGCFCGGRLAAAGADVVFVGRARSKRELEARGLTLTDMAGPAAVVPKEAIVFATDVSALVDRDVILVCVKSAQTAEVGDELARALAGRSNRPIVISMQNGVRNADVLRERLGEGIVLGAIVGFNVVGTGDGAYRRTTSGLLVIESREDPRLAALVAALEAASLTTKLATDIRPLQWAKLVMNVNNAMSALTDVPTRALLFSGRYRRIMRAIVREALAAMRAAGVRPGRLGAVNVRAFPYLMALPTPILRVVARAQVAIDPEARSSMWQDLAAGRTTEVDDLNGEIVRLAEAHGADAPINRRIVELVHRAEAAKAGSPRLSAEDLWRALTA